MNIMDFLKPDPIKFILPIILIAMFALAFSSFSGWAKAQNGFWCNYSNVIKMENESAEFNQTAKNIVYSSDNINSEVANIQSNPTVSLIGSIDPFFPGYCYLSDNCAHYISNETYSCMLEVERYHTLQKKYQQTNWISWYINQ